MPNSVAIASVYQTGYRSESLDVTLEEMIFAASAEALSEFGLAWNEIDNVIMASSDLVDGRVITNMLTSGPAGAYWKEYLNFSSSGGHSLIAAVMRILSDESQIAMVISWSKCSESPIPVTEQLTTDPIYQRGLGLNGLVASAMQCQCYRNRNDTAETAVADVVVKNRSNATANPLAHLRLPITREEVDSSPFIALPLRQLQVPPYSDGVCVLIVAAPERALELTSNPGWIQGMGWASDTYWMGDRPLEQLTSLKIAANQAYAMAQIEKPAKEIDVAEIHDITAYHELMAYEALGFCSEGEGADFMLSGFTKRSGTLPVNPSGGALSSNPVFATGLVRVAEAALQVMGRAGERQVPDVERALAHATHGFASQGNSVFILGKEPLS